MNRRGYGVAVVLTVVLSALLGSIADSLWRIAAALDWIAKACH